MSIVQEKKQELIKKFAINEHDTGSPEVQIAILTTRILNLTEHMKANKKDFHTRRGLLILVGRRKRLLSYLSKTNERRYSTLVQELGLRK